MPEHFIMVGRAVSVTAFDGGSRRSVGKIGKAGCIGKVDQERSR
ncbi:hypothetical protein RSSM_04621 [Rhodopirellula sallentina SM41]|uniref:Uncharacterized protein n=1 Tax=Rhodopirellula sallentina SM41 TaxID=1263870 RepID=M5TXM0_9BACT|nr:hypothetical protein RSSM_04621 [Rhodopirellula sallentina SM41]